MDIQTFNDDWLRAWSNKDTKCVLSFYHPQTVYRDNQVPQGLSGHVALGAYLDELFAATPPMRYEPDETWTTPDGYCGRWICTMDLPDGTHRYLRGFDLVVLRDELIGLNEVYTHNLLAKP